MKKTCRNCGQVGNFTLLFNNPQLLKCSICCGYQWMGNIPNAEALYTQDYFNGDEYVAYEKSAEIYRINLKRKLQIVLKAAFFSGKIPREYLNEPMFEIGSATGEFLKVLRKQGFTKFLGSEISVFCRKVAAQNGFQLLNPLSADYMQSIKNFKPKIICAWDVWEHLENPFSFFNEMVLTNSEVSVIALTTVDSSALVPNIMGTRWRQFHPPTHLNYPTKKSFETFFKSIDFKIKISKSFGYYRPFADYLSVFMGRKQVSTFPFLFKIPLYLNMYDIQMIVAERAH